MEFSLFSATGCMRCKIVKSYMQENSIEYAEYDFKADGKDEFNAFYRKNRSNIYRGKEGVEFPLIYDGETVVQGVGVIIAFLMDQKLLDGFVSRSKLSHGWVDGLYAAAGDETVSDEFVSLVSFLKSSGLQTQIETDGSNAVALEKLVNESLIDKLLFYLKGTPGSYEKITGSAVSESTLSQSLLAMEKCPDFQILLELAPFSGEGDSTEKQIISPEEAGHAAQFVEQATGKKTHPFFIKENIPEDEKEQIGTVNLFKYRTACRRYMVKTDIFKGN